MVYWMQEFFADGSWTWWEFYRSKSVKQFSPMVRVDDPPVTVLGMRYLISQPDERTPAPDIRRLARD